LRSFGIDACNATTTDCSVAANFTRVYTSPGDAFPGAKPRPVAPNLLIRTFDLPQPVTATHLRLVVLTNQCTGMPGIQVDGDNDPTNDSGCIGSGKDNDVVVTELEAFTRPGADLSVKQTGPATLKSGGTATYTITVTNNGPEGATGAIAVDKLPYKADFSTVTTSKGNCSKATASYVTTVTCNLGDLASGATATVTVVAKLRVTGTNTNATTVSEAGPGDP